jgi:hypothetical protein
VDVAAGRSAQRREYLEANVIFVFEAVNGRESFSSGTDPSAGAHAVANIPSVHVPAFVRASLASDLRPYKNGYDLGRYNYRVGDPEPSKLESRRELVDRSLPLPGKARPCDIYFTAVELNGTGIRFYGDVALLLRRETVPNETTILDRNSFELTRDPIAKRIRNGSGRTEDQRRRSEALKLAGKWSADLCDIASIKVLDQLGTGSRQWTPGQISDALLIDEDYIEVLLTKSFSTDNLQDARFAADDAAHESLTADRCRRGPLPRFESILWRHQRRNADAALQASGVWVRVVVTSGRMRS